MSWHRQLTNFMFLIRNLLQKKPDKQKQNLNKNYPKHSGSTRKLKVLISFLSHIQMRILQVWRCASGPRLETNEQ
ncbi:protein of unknown function [Georgfuchsia toluolica]|uniref:Uncharacterized protein n=1 Tax=Georgfuchsia toluolica TaxID=424218 RepID=A0A916N9I2_9PROT|nr:protein of unknown function [Georgfuchsia toluolica]